MIEAPKIVTNRQVTDHFLFEECTCRCCNRLKITPEFFRHMAKLEELRRELGLPVIVNSAYRCPDHNKAVGGVGDSWHLRFATDIRPGDGSPESLRRMYRIALVQGWGGIGLYDTFIHLDLRQETARWDKRSTA